MPATELALVIQQLRHQITLLQQGFQPQSGELGEGLLELLSSILQELQFAEAELERQGEDLQNTQELLRLEQQRYQELFDFAPDAYLATDSQGNIQAANRAAVAMLGQEHQRLMQTSLLNFVAPESYSSFYCDLPSIPANDRRQEWEMRICPHQGKPFDASLAVTRLINPGDQVEIYRWLIRDISSRKHTAKQILTLNTELIRRNVFNITLKSVQDKVRSSLDEDQILQTVIQELGRTLNLLYCDVAVYDLPTQTSTIRHYYASPGIAYLPEQPQIVQMADFPEGYRQLTRGQAFHFCEITTHPLRRQVAIFACPIADHQEVLGDLWCFSPQDLGWNDTEIHLVEQVAAQCAIALRQARLYQAVNHRLVTLGKLNRLKEDFLSTISHELRTPLTNIKMALHLLKVAPGEEQQTRCMQILQQECDREIALVNDLLDLQQLELSNYSTFESEVVSLTEWLNGITAGLRQKVVAHQQILRLNLPPVIPLLRIDQFNLRRLLLELLNNAQKYTPAGGEIILQIAYQPDSATTIFTVRNQAEIPAEELPHIFHKFYRVPQADAWKTAGTGLGLTLVKELVQHLQGAIAVESGNGWTTFTVEIPT